MSTLSRLTGRLISGSLGRLGRSNIRSKGRSNTTRADVSVAPTRGCRSYCRSTPGVTSGPSATAVRVVPVTEDWIGVHGPAVRMAVLPVTQRRYSNRSTQAAVQRQGGRAFLLVAIGQDLMPEVQRVS